MYRTKTNQEIANKAAKQAKLDGCVFCDTEPKAAILKYQHFYIIKNRYPYDFWDYRQVEEHLLLIPHVHTDSLEKIPEKANKDYLALIQGYQAEGYDVFTRAYTSIIKSQPHLHTHLIKTTGDRLEIM